MLGLPYIDCLFAGENSRNLFFVDFKVFFFSEVFKGAVIPPKLALNYLKRSFEASQIKHKYVLSKIVCTFFLISHYQLYVAALFLIFSPIVLFFFFCFVFILSRTVWILPTTRDSVCFLAAHQLNPTTLQIPASAHGKLLFFVVGVGCLYIVLIKLHFFCYQDCHNGVLWQEWPFSWGILRTILFQVRKK